MATQIQNDKRILVIEMTWREYVAAQDCWGWCDLCGTNDFSDNGGIGYYIPMIDQWYCKSCWDKYYATATHYKVDMEKERQKFNEMKQKLERLGVWNIPNKN